MEDHKIEQRGLKKGTVIHLNGIPFVLAENVIVEGHFGNFEVALENGAFQFYSGRQELNVVKEN